MRIPAGFLTDKYGRTQFIFASLLLCGAFIPLFVFAQTLAYVVAIRCAITLASTFASPASSALLADIIPRDIRGRVMAAVGRGSVRIGAASGGTGGPSVGFFTIIPIALASLAGGYLYQWHNTSPWAVVFIVTIIAVVITALFIRDPKQAEI